MSKHPIRKAMGLCVLYSIIIIGIFVLQFRNSSVILKNIGALRINIAQTQEQDGTCTLKNNMLVTFKGITYSADDVHPIKVKLTGSKELQPLTLISWEQPSPLSVKFNFTYNSSIIFTVSDTSSKASLTITAEIPSEVQNLSLFYKPSSGYSVTEQGKTRQLVSSKNVSYTMSAAEIDDTSILFTKNANVSLYTRFDSSKAFSFASIPADSVNASSITTEAIIKNFRAKVVSLVTQSLQDSSAIPENAIAAYIAELASQGKYAEAIQTIPDSFKKGGRRTYFTAPYFNSLVSMNPSLVMANDNLSNMVKNAVHQQNMDLFEAEGITDYILRNESDQNVQNLLSLPSKNSDYKPTVSQATGILRAYLKLSKASSPMAATLSPLIQSCLDSITNSCTISADTLNLTENDIPVSFTQAVETGAILLEYGKYTNSAEFISGGNMLINSAFEKNQNSDLRILAELYPILVPSNNAYPHYKVLQNSENGTIWAWTVANNITYKENTEANTATITLNFKQGDTHYLIIKGIKPFSNIEIYGLSFHTDPRFETYNSSGYVYNEATQTLFIKSRHKVANENIVLSYKKPKIENSAPKPAPETKPAAPEPAASATSQPAPSSQPQEATPAVPSENQEYTPIPEQSDE